MQVCISSSSIKRKSNVNMMGAYTSSVVVKYIHYYTGGAGPRLESFVFAVDAEGLQVLQEAGMFWTRSCKLCGDAGSGIVVGGEYGLTTTLLARGFTVRTLLTKYSPKVGEILCHRIKLCCGTCAPHRPTGGSQSTGTATTMCTRHGTAPMTA